ncbi:hypothetical protein O3W52_33970 [Ensifer psoraleae]|uniref:Uncharacterized protein n=1 Tax=Sinorhizobium psoraleae TaxID=520838 RepID=A0ABT4KRW2_9HYPH|nr:hypothetical protein [Sinorhizobium psoraleae]MCZ4094698.1 hypothetical protein [Sinorhizobium psoraleae]
MLLSFAAPVTFSVPPVVTRAESLPTILLVAPPAALEIESQRAATDSRVAGIGAGTGQRLGAGAQLAEAAGARNAAAEARGGADRRLDGELGAAEVERAAGASQLRQRLAEAVEVQRAAIDLKAGRAGEGIG